MTMRKTLTTLALAAALPAAALAGTVQPARTGQTATLATGDDGALKTGAAWPAPRFTANADLVVTDNLTGLAWPKDGDTPAPAALCGGPGTARSWQGALDYVACLNANAYLGRTDWRLPNAAELASLSSAGETDSAAWLSEPRQGFGGVRADFYWSSTSNAGSAATLAWSVRVSDGTIFDEAKTALLPVFPVRGGALGDPNPAWLGSLRATGQTVGVAAGDDGALKRGVSWPSPRFSASADGTVTDRLTRLVWSGDAGTPAVSACTGGVKDWQGALDYVACLNGAGYLGRSDWRLPNRAELATLIDYGRSTPALPSSHPFTHVRNDFYWSSTTNAAATGFAWAAGLGDGIVFDGDKQAALYVWPVSGPGGAPASAGTVALPRTGQATSSAAGDDGAVKAGMVAPSPRFSANGDQTLTDRLTGLVWSSNADTPAPPGLCGGPGIDRTWQQALDHVACLNANAYLGRTDWRLPNLNELETLSDAGAADAVAALAGAGFTGVRNEYWSSTTEKGAPSFAWGVDMRDGEVFSAEKGDALLPLSVWPVRGGEGGSPPPARTPRTGQTVRNAAGDDGDLTAGVPWHSPRFAVNADQSVTDKLTRLVWGRDAGTPLLAGGGSPCAAGRKDWQGALDYVACLNSKGYLGRSDWRLPNRNELRSLVDYGSTAPALAAGHPFVHVEDFYWTSTTDPSDGTAAWIANLAGGELYAIPKESAALVLPVRGGQSIGVSPAFGDFGAPPAGSGAVDRSFQVTNRGTMDLQIGSVLLGGADAGSFSVKTADCAGVLTPGSSCGITVSFTPAAEGFASATLTVASNDPATPLSELSLSGQVPDVTPPAVVITSPAAGYTNIASPPLGFTAGGGHAVVKVDGAVVNRASGERLLPLSEGAHVLRVESSDVAGNTGAAEVSLTVVRPNGKLTDGGVGAVSLGDVLQALRIAVEVVPVPTDVTYYTGDVSPQENGLPSPDGVIDIGDAVQILRKLVGLTEGW